jgi:hypothetical protein
MPLVLALPERGWALPPQDAPAWRASGSIGKFVIATSISNLRATSLFTEGHCVGYCLGRKSERGADRIRGAQRRPPVEAK